MGKISKDVSKGLGSAIKEAQAKMADNTEQNDDIEALLNSGAEAQKKRKRRTKAEIEAVKQTEESNSLFEALEIKKEESSGPKNHDEFCELELKKAHDKGLPEPDFDFRSYYEKGQIVYFVRVLAPLGEKEIRKLYLRTIYPRMIIGTEEKSSCQCIGYQDRDRIFDTPREAQACYDSIKLTSKYAEEPKSRRNKHKSTDEEVEEEINEYEAYMSLDEDDD